MQEKHGRLDLLFRTDEFRSYLQVADKFPGDAVVIGARELDVGVARTRSLGAQGDVVFVGTVFAIVVAVARLPA